VGHFICGLEGDLTFVIPSHNRTRTLEGRVSELEQEASRLLHSLETQKDFASEKESGMSRKLADSAKELAQKVRGASPTS
jgi:hypothetical protein